MITNRILGRRFSIGGLLAGFAPDPYEQSDLVDRALWGGFCLLLWKPSQNEGLLGLLGETSGRA